MKNAFISGIPASGKSYLAEKIAKDIGAWHINIDWWREEIKDDPEFKKWIDFFFNQDEKEYLRVIECGEHFCNLKNQSEVLWPVILKRIKNIQSFGKFTIFEGVNILPHLARRDLDFEGIVFLGESYEKILERNKKEPRWGKTEELQIKEADLFYNCERLKYKQEAEKYGFKTFSDPLEAENALLSILNF